MITLRESKRKHCKYLWMLNWKLFKWDFYSHKLIVELTNKHPSTNQGSLEWSLMLWNMIKWLIIQEMQRIAWTLWCLNGLKSRTCRRRRLVMTCRGQKCRQNISADQFNWSDTENHSCVSEKWTIHTFIYSLSALKSLQTLTCLLFCFWTFWLNTERNFFCECDSDVNCVWNSCFLFRSDSLTAVSEPTGSDAGTVAQRRQKKEAEKKKQNKQRRRRSREEAEEEAEET